MQSCHGLSKLGAEHVPDCLAVCGAHQAALYPPGPLRAYYAAGLPRMMGTHPARARAEPMGALYAMNRLGAGLGLRCAGFGCYGRQRFGRAESAEKLIQASGLAGVQSRLGRQ